MLIFSEPQKKRVSCLLIDIDSKRSSVKQPTVKSLMNTRAVVIVPTIDEEVLLFEGETTSQAVADAVDFIDPVDYESQLEVKKEKCSQNS